MASTNSWLRASAVSLTVSAMLAATSGVASADRGGDSGSSDSGTRAARGNATAPASPTESTSRASRGAASVKPSKPAEKAGSSDDFPAAPAPAASVPAASAAKSAAPQSAAVVSAPAATVPAGGKAGSNGKGGLLPLGFQAPLAAKASDGGPFLGLFGNGTATSPNGGLVWGNGFSYDATTCPSGTVCNGGNAGFLFGDGGNGFNGGNGGRGGLLGTHVAGLFVGITILPFSFTGFAGDGGDAASDCVVKKITCNGGNGGNSLGTTGGGKGGNGAATGNGGNGGNGLNPFSFPTARDITAGKVFLPDGGNGGPLGGNGGNGGNSPWIIGAGGNGGNGGIGGKGGAGGKGGLLSVALDERNNGKPGNNG